MKLNSGRRGCHVNLDNEQLGVLLRPREDDPGEHGVEAHAQREVGGAEQHVAPQVRV